MVASQVKRAVGVFPNRQTAETALTELQGANFPMELGVCDCQASRGRRTQGC